MAKELAGITTGHTDYERLVSHRQEASIINRYLPLIVSAIVVMLLSVFFYRRGDEAFADKWIAAEVTFSISLALISAALHTRVWSIRNAGVTWLMLGTLLLYGGLATELWNASHPLDDVILAVMRASLTVSGPMMVYGVIQYNRSQSSEGRVHYDEGMVQENIEGHAEGVADEKADQYDREQARGAYD
jgi:hypothetical protein